MTDSIKAWQCIGCGKIEAPQTCADICQDKKVELVFAQEHRAAISVLETQNQSMASLIRQLAPATPRDGKWERSYLALQSLARNLIIDCEHVPNKPAQ